MLFENPVPLNMRLRMQPRSVTFDRMASIFTKRTFPKFLSKGKTRVKFRIERIFKITRLLMASASALII